MARVLLEDLQSVGKMTLLESPQQNSSVLGKFGGPFASLGEPTRNDRIYSEELWDRVLESDYLKEQMIDSKMLFGEVDHPQDYVEMRALPSAFNIIKLEKRKDEGILYGEAEILDTPSGRILYTLLKYGSKVGISSRGSGSVITEGGKSYVDPDDYVFVTFDVVSQPSVFKAREGLIENKETIRDWERVLEREILEADAVGIGIYKNLISSLGEKTKSRFMTLVENRETTLLNSSEYDKTIKTLTEEKEKLLAEVRELKNTITRQSGLSKRLKERLSLVESKKEDVVKLETEKKELEEKLDSVNKRNRSLIEKVKKLSNDLFESKKTVITLNKEKMKLNEKIKSQKKGNEKVLVEKIKKEAKEPSKKEVKRIVSEAVLPDEGNKEINESNEAYKSLGRLFAKNKSR